MKKIAVLLALVLFLGAGISAACYIAKEVPVTYDGSKTDVSELMQDYEANKDTYLNDNRNPDEKTEGERVLPENPDGIASIIVTTDLSETQAMNDVAPIVFDYRGYDTMGESFILLTAISGSYIILKNMKGRKEEEADDE